MHRARPLGVLLLTAIFSSTLLSQTQLPESKPDLSCRLIVGNTDWRTDRPAWVQVELSNDSHRAVDVFVVPIFYLTPKFSPGQWPTNEGGYWAPTNIVENHALETDTVGKGKRTGLRPRELKLTIAEESTASYRVDMTATRWEWRMSSIWPNMPLSKLVPTGKYFLSLEIGDQKPIPCNKIAVQITKVPSETK